MVDMLMLVSQLQAKFELLSTAAIAMHSNCFAKLVTEAVQTQPSLGGHETLRLTSPSQKREMLLRWSRNAGG